jgi:hypothetical protein
MVDKKKLSDLIDCDSLRILGSLCAHSSRDSITRFYTLRFFDLVTSCGHGDHHPNKFPISYSRICFFSNNI